MYLFRNIYFYGDEKKKLKISGVEGIHLDKVKIIQEEALYWRKMNAIHKWFVQNVQKGNDDCSTYDVSLEQLRELLSTIKKVLKDRNMAEDLLPPGEGFFFGGAEIDIFYFDELVRTERELYKLLKEAKENEKRKGPFWCFRYSSSW